jgi:hypothetical protein
MMHPMTYLARQIVLGVKNPKVKPIKLEKNSRKTAAFQRDLLEVSGDITIIQDADLE